MSEIETTLSRISSYEGVERILLIKSVESDDMIQSMVMKSMGNKNNELNQEEEKKKENQYAKFIPQLAREARILIKQIDAKNDLTFLRIKTTEHELLIAPDKDFYLCTLQNMSKK